MAGPGQRRQGEWKDGTRERWIIFDNDSDALDKMEIRMEGIKQKYLSLTEQQIEFPPLQYERC